jgi:hypothetical protein
MSFPTRLACALVITGVSLGGCSSPPKKKPLTLQEMITADPLPLAKGSKWTYSVNVKRFDAEQNKVDTKTLSWVTEVVDVREADGVMAYRVRGWPSDLIEYDGTAAAPTPTEVTILRKDNAFLFGETSEPTLEGATGWFSWPVIDGQKICPTRIAYCWLVSAVETGYQLTFHTGPDEQSFVLEPGTGVARFRYAHHGTTNEVDARLVSYTKGPTH